MASTTTKPRQGKTAKGLLAAGLGAALLLGTGGTFALWQVSENTDRVEFQTGEMTLTAPNFDWKYTNLTFQNQPNPQPGTERPLYDEFRLAPGYMLIGRTTITPTLVGENLTAQVQFGGGTVINTAGESLIETVVLINGSPVEKFDGKYLKADGPVDLEVRIKFLRATHADGMGEDVGIDELKVTLKQTGPWL